MGCFASHQHERHVLRGDILQAHTMWGCVGQLRGTQASHVQRIARVDIALTVHHHHHHHYYEHYHDHYHYHRYKRVHLPASDVCMWGLEVGRGDLHTHLLPLSHINTSVARAGRTHAHLCRTHKRFCITCTHRCRTHTHPCRTHLRISAAHIHILPRTHTNIRL